MVLKIFIFLFVFTSKAVWCFEFCEGNYCYYTTNETYPYNREEAVLYCTTNFAENEVTLLELDIGPEEGNTIGSKRELTGKDILLNINKTFYDDFMDLEGNVFKEPIDSSGPNNRFLYAKTTGNTFTFYRGFYTDMRHVICVYDDCTNIPAGVEVSNKCYKDYKSTTLNWFEAINYCIDNNGKIADLQNVTNVISLLNAFDSSTGYHMGVSKVQWFWGSSDERITRTNWSPFFPLYLDSESSKYQVFFHFDSGTNNSVGWRDSESGSFKNYAIVCKGDFLTTLTESTSTTFITSSTTTSLAQTTDTFNTTAVNDIRIKMRFDQDLRKSCLLIILIPGLFIGLTMYILMCWKLSRKRTESTLTNVDTILKHYEK